MKTIASVWPVKRRYGKVPKAVRFGTVVDFHFDAAVSSRQWFAQPTYMLDALWCKIIDDSRGLGVTYRPYLFCEPLVDRRLPEIVRYIKRDPTARVEIQTDAQLLTPKLSDQFIRLGVDSFRFQLPGIFSNSFEPGGQEIYEQTMEQVRYFLCQVNHLGSKIQTHLRMPKRDDNTEEFFAFSSYWRKYKPTSVDIAMSKTYPWEHGKVHLNKPCPNISSELTFLVDGTATLCNLDREGRQLVGDIAQTNLLDIWNGKEMVRCRDLLDHGERSRLALCQGCSAYANVDFSDWEGYTAKPSALQAVIKFLEVEELN